MRRFTNEQRAASDQLTELGYSSEFRREMSPWANFSLGFTYLSPVVSTYTCSPSRWPTAGRR